MPVFIAFLQLCGANILVWCIVLMMGGTFFPQSLSTFYANTSLLSRALISGLAYTLAIIGFALPFTYHPAMSSFVQAVFNGGFVVILPVMLGGKTLTPLVGVAGAVMLAASLFLSYAIHVAPSRLG